LGAVILSWTFAVVVFFIESRVRPELIMVQALTHTLVARAAIVPSSGARTLVVGVVGAAPFVASAHLAHAHGNDPDWLGGPSIAMLTAVLWTSIAVGMSVVVSNVIYGLQRRVAQARRLGQYTLEEKIGEGGMGEVWKARHAMLRRPTAVKLLPPDKAGAHNLARFEREVQLTSTLTHPNTVAIYDFGRTPDGLFYYAMEYLDGVTLEELVRKHGPQPPGRVVHVLRQVVGALAEAHAAGLIHRDIKPANVLLCERGGAIDVVKVVDFGLVKSLSETALTGELALSNVNVLTGTPLYLAPEAITSPETLDGRADLYAVGAVAYFLLTGRTVFEGATVVEVCGHHLHSKPVPPSARTAAHVPAD
ncbi:serine/threonine protein kinase, partial [bacterium]